MNIVMKVDNMLIVDDGKDIIQEVIREDETIVNEFVPDEFEELNFDN